MCCIRGKTVSLLSKVSPTSCAVPLAIYLIHCIAKCIRIWINPSVTTLLLHLTIHTWQETNCSPSPEWRCMHECCRMAVDVLKVYQWCNLLVVRSMMDISFKCKVSGKLKALVLCCLINFSGNLLFSSSLNSSFSVGNDLLRQTSSTPLFSPACCRVVTLFSVSANFLLSHVYAKHF